MKYLKTLNIKSSHFTNGVAPFDGIDHKQLNQAIDEGAVVEQNKNVDWAIEQLEDGLYCFGKISKSGIIVLEGIRGYIWDAHKIDDMHSKEKEFKKFSVQPYYVFCEFK